LDYSPASFMERRVQYADLLSRGYQPPDLEAAAAAAAPPKLAPTSQAVLPASATLPDPVLVLGEGGRWKLVPAPGVHVEPLPRLQRPGSVLVSGLRKRKLQAELTAVTSMPGSVFDIARTAGAVSSEKEAEAEARRRLKERRLEASLKQSRGRSSAQQHKAGS